MPLTAEQRSDPYYQERLDDWEHWANYRKGRVEEEISDILRRQRAGRGTAVSRRQLTKNVGLLEELVRDERSLWTSYTNRWRMVRSLIRGKNVLAGKPPGDPQPSSYTDPATGAVGTMFTSGGTAVAVPGAGVTYQMGPVPTDRTAPAPPVVSANTGTAFAPRESRRTMATLTTFVAGSGYQRGSTGGSTTSGATTGGDVSGELTVEQQRQAFQWVRIAQGIISNIESEIAVILEEKRKGRFPTLAFGRLRNHKALANNALRQPRAEWVAPDKQWLLKRAVFRAENVLAGKPPGEPPAPEKAVGTREQEVKTGVAVQPGTFFLPPPPSVATDDMPVSYTDTVFGRMKESFVTNPIPWIAGSVVAAGLVYWLVRR